MSATTPYGTYGYDQILAGTNNIGYSVSIGLKAQPILEGHMDVTKTSRINFKTILKFVKDNRKNYKK